MTTQAGSPNPFAADVADPLPGPTTLVLFGATGDLAARKLLPAVYNLALAGRLPERFRLVGTGRSLDSDDDFRAHARAAVERFSRHPLDEATWAALSQQIAFEPGALDDPDLFDRLATRIEAGERDAGGPTRRLFYLAVAPRFFEPVVSAVAAEALAGGGPDRGAVLIEKPFGQDLASAMELNEILRSGGFSESQVFRIDHYLGKEMVQNVLVLRFANGIFEPLWNCDHIDHVQITVAEDLGVERRGGYYDGAGALRDVIQNHALQLLSLVAMEPPASFEADAVRDEKVRALRAVDGFDVAAAAVRGQYGPGQVTGEAVPGYRDEEGVVTDSSTDTYAALRLEIDNPRWAGTPFYLRSGKRLPRRATEIAIRFRPPPRAIFERAGADAPPANELVLSVQPSEGASLRIAAKVPGGEMTLRPVQMDFRYGSAFLRESPEAYERLLDDAMQGDTGLFTRADEVEAAWRIVDPVLVAWQAEETRLEPYPAGGAGPEAADALLARDGRAWRAL